MKDQWMSIWTYAWSVGVRQNAQEIENQAASNGDDAGTNALKLISFLSQNNSKNWSYAQEIIEREGIDINNKKYSHVRNPT